MVDECFCVEMSEEGEVTVLDCLQEAVHAEKVRIGLFAFLCEEGILTRGDLRRDL